MAKSSQNERPPGKFYENRAVSEVRTGSYPGENRLVGSIGQDRKIGGQTGLEAVDKNEFLTVAQQDPAAVGIWSDKQKGFYDPGVKLLLSAGMLTHNESRPAPENTGKTTPWKEYRGNEFNHHKQTKSV